MSTAFEQIQGMVLPILITSLIYKILDKLDVVKWISMLRDYVYGYKVFTVEATIQHGYELYELKECHI
jgi:hypothetical protein